MEKNRNKNRSDLFEPGQSYSLKWKMVVPRLITVAVEMEKLSLYIFFQDEIIVSYWWSVCEVRGKEWNQEWILGFCWSRQRGGCGIWLRGEKEGAEGLGTCSGAAGSSCLDARSDCDPSKWCCQVGGRVERPDRSGKVWTREIKMCLWSSRHGRGCLGRVCEARRGQEAWYLDTRQGKAIQPRGGGRSGQWGMKAICLEI